MFLRKLLFLWIFVLIVPEGISQPLNLNISRDWLSHNQLTTFFADTNQASLHPARANLNSFQPKCAAKNPFSRLLTCNEPVDSIFKSGWYKIEANSVFGKILYPVWYVFSAPLRSFEFNDTTVFIQIHPLYNVSKGRIKESGKSTYTNSRGALVRGTINRTLGFETYFMETQSVFPDFIDSVNKETKVVPGQGRWKVFKTSGYDYAFGSGYFNWEVNPRVNLQAGHGKHFVGNGYRSLLLSDNSFNYPYIKTGLKNKWLEYNVVYASLQNLQPVYANPFVEPLFVRKSATFHYLEVNYKRRIFIGLFEGTIWKSRYSDSSSFNYASLNPIIFSSTLSNGLQSKNNVVAGINFSFIPFKGFKGYGQYLIDDTKDYRSAYQVGVSYFYKFFFLQTEYNTAAVKTYLHKRPVQSYSHYNQPLAHPITSGFSEVLVRGGLRYKRLSMEGRYITSEYGSNRPYNVLTKEIENVTGGVSSLRSVSNIYGSFNMMVNPNSRLNVFIAAQKRIGRLKEGSDSQTWIFAGLQTSLFSSNYDF